jgi:hypothetical protein
MEGASSSSEDAYLLRRHVETWRRAGPLLEKQREADVKACGGDAIEAFRFFAGLVLPAVKSSELRDDLGLVEQQRWFRKIAKG